MTFSTPQPATVVRSVCSPDTVDVQLAVYDSCAAANLSAMLDRVLLPLVGTTYGAYIPLQMTMGEEYIIAVSTQNISR